jgi:transcriptional regulator NrdR family protein
MPRGPHHIANPACPYCEAKDSAVEETRPMADGGTRRRRLCRFCNRIFPTVEYAVLPKEGKQFARKPPR